MHKKNTAGLTEEAYHSYWKSLNKVNIFLAYPQNSLTGQLIVDDVSLKVVFAEGDVEPITVL